MFVSLRQMKCICSSETNIFGMTLKLLKHYVVYTDSTMFYMIIYKAQNIMLIDTLAISYVDYTCDYATDIIGL